MIHAPFPPAGVSQTSVNVLTALLEARTGQQLATYRSWRIDTALKPLMRARGYVTLDQMVLQLMHGQDRTIADQIVDALLNQETSFFRDASTFDQIVDVVAVAEASGRRARIWCAGCSTGQEPLSVAMLFAERAETLSLPMPEIVASDVSEPALARARSGRYTQFEIQRGLPIRRMVRWFEEAGSDWAAKPELMKAIMFRRVNVVADQPPPGQFDLVMCRNVMLYLDAPTRTKVFAMIARAMRPGSTLVLGASETVIGQTAAFAPSTVWRGFYTAQG